MRRIISFVVLVVVTGGLVFAAFSSYQSRDQSTSSSNDNLFVPGLADRVNETVRIRGVNSGGPFTIEREGNQWRVAERAGYTANAESVQELLIGLTELRLVEKKTAKPARYAALGLEEPGTEGANSQSIRLENDAGEPLIELVIGDRKPARRRQMVSDIYVRTVGEKQTWTVEGSLPNIVDTVGWLADSLIELESRRVRQVQVRHADGGLTTVNHTPGVGQGYSLENVPEGREIDSGYVVQSVVTGIMKFPLDDVGAAEDLAAAKGEDLTITITAYDGLQVTMKGVLNDEDAVLAFSARYLADEAKHPAPKAEGQQKNTDIIKLTKDAVVAEVERLNRRWAPWTFTVGKWRLATALKKVDEFLKPEPDPAAADVTPTPTATAPIVGPTNVAKPNQ